MLNPLGSLLKRYSWACIEMPKKMARRRKRAFFIVDSIIGDKNRKILKTRTKNPPNILTDFFVGTHRMRPNNNAHRVRPLVAFTDTRGVSLQTNAVIPPRFSVFCHLFSHNIGLAAIQWSSFHQFPWSLWFARAYCSPSNVPCPPP